MHTFWYIRWCCYLTQNFAFFWCILVLLYAYLNLERMKSDTCFDVFRCILKSILILMQLYEPRDSPFCSIEVSVLFTGNRSLTNTAQTEQTSIAAGKPLDSSVVCKNKATRCNLYSLCPTRAKIYNLWNKTYY